MSAAGDRAPEGAEAPTSGDARAPVPGSAVLGLDVGDARIGVAAGRIGSGFAFGRGVVPARDPQQAVEEIAARARHEGATWIVVGLPLRTDGRPSAQAERVRAFADALRAAGFTIVFEDERFTSEIAKQHLRASGAPRSRRREKGRIDEGAARLILETYLQRFATPPPPPPELAP